MTVLKILENFKSFEDYKNAKASSKAYILGSALTRKTLSELARNNKKHHCFKKFVNYSDDIFIYHKSCHKKYKSGKSFSRNAWFEINIQTVELAFAKGKTYWNTNNTMLLDRHSHKWIDKHIFNIAKEHKMTKTLKAEVYKKYEQGNGALASPEAEIKEIEKQERRKAKVQEKRIKRIAQKTLIEEHTKIAKLEQTIVELKAEIEQLKSLKDLNSDIPEEDKDFVIEYDDLGKYFPDGIDQDDPKDQELMKHMSKHCKMRLDYEFEKERKAMEDKPITADEAEAQISACQRLLDSGELEDDDIPSEEEQLALRKKTVSYRLQEFHDKGYLQASEAERLRQCSIYEDLLPKIKDKGISQSDTSHNLAARKTICNYIDLNKNEFGLDFDTLEDLDNTHLQLHKWLTVTERCCSVCK